MNDKEIITLYLIVNAREQVVKCAYSLDMVQKWFSDSFIHYDMVGLKFDRNQYKDYHKRRGKIMNYKTIEIASKCYIKNLKNKQKWYGIDDHDLGQAEKYVESFTHYLLYLEHNNIVAISDEGLNDEEA